jgi:hypothetical protein
MKSQTGYQFSLLNCHFVVLSERAVSLQLQLSAIAVKLLTVRAVKYLVADFDIV